MGAGPALLAFDPALEFNDQFPKFVPGEEYEYNGSRYRYMKFDNGAGNVASAAGAAAYWSSLTTPTCTTDKTGNLAGAAIPAGCCGVFLGVVTDGWFTFLLRKGPMTVSLAAGDSNGAVGNKIFAPAADVDLTFRSEADASVSAAEIPATELGRQYAAGAANAALCYMNIP